MEKHKVKQDSRAFQLVRNSFRLLYACRQEFPIAMNSSSKLYKFKLFELRSSAYALVSPNVPAVERRAPM